VYDWLVQVAPLTMSTLVPWDASTDWVSSGTAWLLIRLLWRSLGDSTTETDVIAPFLITTWTWNGPHGSDTAWPVQVPSLYRTVEPDPDVDPEPSVVGAAVAPVDPEPDVDPDLELDPEVPAEPDLAADPLVAVFAWAVESSVS
jgi:hypothetical protein